MEVRRISLKATRRRPRQIDPLASPGAVRSVCNLLRNALPPIIPSRDKDLVRMLRAVRHLQRYPATDTLRGRPSPWAREDLLKVGSKLAEILARETSSRISVSSFVDHYLRILDFPADVSQALIEGQINLFEAEQLARITPRRSSLAPRQCLRVRSDLLASHLTTKASAERLRRRVNELLLSQAPAVSSGPSEGLEDFDPYDSTHLFWEQIKQLGFAFREIRREDLLEGEIEELLKASEPILAVLSRIKRRSLNLIR